MKIQSFNHCAYLLTALLWSFSATANPIHSFAFDPVQEAKLLAFDGMADDYFGVAVDISGDWAVVGASYHDGVDSNEGAVYVYRYDGVNWIFDQKLTADDATDSDRFGQAVSVDGDRLMVGAFRVDDNGGDSGAVYVFDYDGANWNQSQKLLASDGTNSDWFGFHLSLQGDLVAIGARNANNDSSLETGAVYVFIYNGSSWLEQQKLEASDAAENAKFGHAVSLSGERLLVGAYFDGKATQNLGAAYVFDYNNSNNLWVESAKLVSNEGVDQGLFGYAVSLSGDRALVGAMEDTGNVAESGAAYVFDYDGQNWTQTQQLTVPTLNGGGQLGYAVSLQADRALVGANKDNANGFISGAVYVYDLLGSEWLQVDQLAGVDTETRDEFGAAIGVSGGKALIGAFRDTELGNNAGSAYVLNVPYQLSVAVSGLAAGNSVELENNGGDALLVDDNGTAVFSTPLFVGESFAITVSSQPTIPNQTCVVNQGTGQVAPTGVTGVHVVCATNPYFIGGFVKGLLSGNHLVVQNNGVDLLHIEGSQSFSFAMPVDDQQAYDVIISEQADDPIQPCVVNNGQGLVSGDDVTDVLVVCQPGNDLIYREGFDPPDEA